MAFEILVAGVGDAFSTRHYGTHFFFRKGDFVLAIDCPDGFRKALEHQNFGEGTSVEIADIDALYLTHLHGDHVNGLEMTLALRSLALQLAPLPIYGFPEVLDDLWPRRLQVSLGQMYDGARHQSVAPEKYFKLSRLDTEHSHRIGPFNVELRCTRHHIPTTAMRIFDDSAGIGYSCDTAFDPDLIDWLADGTEIIFHECTFGAAHTQLHELQELAPSIQKKLRLVHYSDQMIGMDTGNLRMAQQGEVIRVGDRNQGLSENF